MRGRRSRMTVIASVLMAMLTALATAFAAPTTSAAAAGKVAKDGPLSVAYVEVNNDSMLNVGKYTLKDSGENVFDIAVIFAANINYDGTNAYLHFNDNVQNVLDNADTQIRPLQEKGIKVVLSVLGNHEGAGFSNFPSQAAAAAFATQLSDTVSKYGLDGIDFDDEYADYGTNGTGQPNDSSFVYLVSALRDQMPDKLITFYFYGPASSRLTYDGVDAGAKLDYSWNAMYGTWSPPAVSLGKDRLSPAAVDIRNTGAGTATDLARQTVSEGYGVYLTYNLGGGDTSGYISGFTRELYGKDAVYTP
ncbi:endo-beta-N-acetylglucosaminidase H [Luteipulveratus mongoliensis]|nr:endo-beta-N-acetylglucosaminidase H [Luteipulveratus mongoliensis]